MSKIEWTDVVWNPVVGCTRVSAGCDHCYAVGMTRRLGSMASMKGVYGGLVNEGKGKHFNGVVRCLPERLGIPFGWRKPRKVFVNSMSDLFHPSVPFEFIDQVFAVMGATPDHTYQVLTKRPERMAEWASRTRTYTDGHGQTRTVGTRDLVLGAAVAMEATGAGGWLSGLALSSRPWPLPNVWLGVSVEDQRSADARIPHLLDTPAAVRFLSCEPLLGPVDFDLIQSNEEGDEWYASTLKAGIDWVIAGGESGPGARPMHPDWVRGVRDQCLEAGVAFFFKQWGAWAPIRRQHYLPSPGMCWAFDTGGHHKCVGHEDAADPRAALMVRAGKKRAGRLLDGRTWDEMPLLRRSGYGGHAGDRDTSAARGAARPPGGAEGCG